MSKLSFLTFTIIVLFCLVVGYGWISNIVRFVRLDFQSPYKAEVLRGVGIVVAPMGVVEGFIKIKD